MKALQIAILALTVTASLVLGYVVRTGATAQEAVREITATVLSYSAAPPKPTKTPVPARVRVATGTKTQWSNRTTPTPVPTPVDVTQTVVEGRCFKRKGKVMRVNTAAPVLAIGALLDDPPQHTLEPGYMVCRIETNTIAGTEYAFIAYLEPNTGLFQDDVGGHVENRFLSYANPKDVPYGPERVRYDCDRNPNDYMDTIHVSMHLRVGPGPNAEMVRPLVEYAAGQDVCVMDVIGDYALVLYWDIYLKSLETGYMPLRHLQSFWK